MVLQILALISFGCIVNGQIYTNNCTTYDPAKTKCAADYPVSVGAVDHKSFWRANPLDGYCNSANKENFKKQVACLIDAERACADDQFKTLLAPGSAYASGVETVCTNVAEFDSDCLSNMFSGCVAVKFSGHNQPQQPFDFKGWKEYQCKLFKEYVSCLDEDTRVINCAKSKTKETMKMIFEITRPTACGDVVDVDGNGDGDDDGNGDGDGDDDGNVDGDGDGDNGNGASGILLLPFVLITSMFVSLLL